MGINEDKISVEISSSSPLATIISVFCVMTIGINLFVCYQIYRRRSLRSSCTALIVANLAVVDMLVSIKDLPMLFAVSMSGRWYFEEHWCRSYGLTNVIYIIVSISTLVTITTEQYLKLTETPKESTQTQNNRTNRSILLGYIIAHTTLSYSLSLLWSKYVFISRKAFCQVDWPPSGLSFTIVASCVFLVPVSLLVYNIFNSDDDNQNSEKQIKLSSQEDKDRDEVDVDSQTRLQLAIGLFLLTWCPYVIESFFSVNEDVPNVVGLICAFIPICTTTLIPLWYLKWKRQAERRAAHSQIFILQC